MLKSLLTPAFVGLFAAHAFPLHAVDDVRAGVRPDLMDIVESGTVVQMPANPNGGRARAATERMPKGSPRAPISVAAKAPRPAAAVGTRIPRPDPVADEPGADDSDQARAGEGAVRITIIGPDGEPRTKIVRLSGSRDGLTAPARRPHD